MLDKYRQVVTQGRGLIFDRCVGQLDFMFIRQTGPYFVTCETTITLTHNYQKNATYLCIITVNQEMVLQFFYLTYCTKLRYRRDILQRLRMLRAEHYLHKLKQAMKERSQV